MSASVELLTCLQEVLYVGLSFHCLVDCLFFFIKKKSALACSVAEFKISVLVNLAPLRFFFSLSGAA